MKKKLSILLMVAALLVSLVLPEGKALAMTSTEDGVINKDYVELDLGASFKVSINGAKSKEVKFSSSNKEVATVDGNGTITAVSEGFVDITAKYKNKPQVCKVAVFDSNKRSQVVGAGKYVEGEDLPEGDYSIRVSCTSYVSLYDNEDNRVINTCLGSSTVYTIHLKKGYTLQLEEQSIISETRKLALENKAGTVKLSEKKWTAIGAGTYEEGVDLAKGNYDIKFDGTDYISVYDKDDNRIINECVGSSTIYTVHIKEGYTLRLEGQGKIRLAKKLK